MFSVLGLVFALGAGRMEGSKRQFGMLEEQTAMHQEEGNSVS